MKNLTAKPTAEIVDIITDATHAMDYETRFDAALELVTCPGKRADLMEQYQAAAEITDDMTRMQRKGVVLVKAIAAIGE